MRRSTGGGGLGGIRAGEAIDTVPVVGSGGTGGATKPSVAHVSASLCGGRHDRAARSERERMLSTTATMRIPMHAPAVFAMMSSTLGVRLSSMQALHALDRHGDDDRDRQDQDGGAAG